MKKFKLINNKYVLFIDGSIYSLLKSKWLKPQYNSAEYVYYYLGDRWQFIHRLVYELFNGPIIECYEINHIDMDKNNNHIRNLESITHKENINKARQLKPWNTGRPPGYKASNETKLKMATKKHKQIRVEDMQGNTIEVFNSISNLLASYSWYRKKFNRIMKDNNGIYKDIVLKYV